MGDDLGVLPGHHAGQDDATRARNLRAQYDQHVADNTDCRTAEAGQRITESAALERLSQLSSRLWQASTLRQGLEEMLSATIELLAADFGNIQILDLQRGALLIEAHSGFPQDFLDFFREVSVDDESACGRALRSGARVIVEDIETDAAFEPLRPIARSAGFRAVQSTPLVGHSGRMLGIISTHYRDSHRPTEQELRLLDLYARQAAAFIERCDADAQKTRTEMALRASEERLAVELAGMTRLHELSLRLARITDLDQVLREVMEAAGELLHAECLTAQLLDPRNQCLLLVADRGFDQNFLEPFRVVVDSGASTCAKALRVRQRVIVENLAADPEFGEFAVLAGPAGIGAAVSTPLLADDGRLLGIFTTYWRGPHRCSEHQLQLLELYVQQAARQVERRAAERALRESQERLAAEVADLETLRNLSLRVAATSDRTAALDDVLETAIRMVGAARGNVQLYDPDEEELRIIAHRGFTSEFLEDFKSVRGGFSCCGAAMKQRERIIIEDVFAESRFSELGPIFARHGCVAVQSTPLFRSDGRMLGMFSTHFASPQRPSERDLRVLDQFAQQAGRIIERTSAELALRESEERFRTLVEAAPFGMYIVDSRLRFAHMNQRSQQGTFRDVQPIIGRRLAEIMRLLWPELVAQQIIESFRRTLATGKPYYSRDFVNLRMDIGTIESYEWELQRIPLSEKEFGVICYYFDSSELRRAEEALRKADRRKDEFLATLAHELRNPLAPIRSGLEVMRIARDDPATIEEIRRTMVRQTEQLVRLIDDLLDVSRITRGKLRLQLAETDLNEIVTSAVDAIRPYIDEKEHRLTVTLPPASLRVAGDPHRLAQVISNLLHNAAKYSPRPGPILLTAVAEGRDIVVSVRDHGIGIPPGKLLEVFEMFAQIGRSGEHGYYTGLGIGLTLAKSLVEMHRGTIQVNSAGHNQGTEVVVRIPNCLLSHSESPAPPTESDNPSCSRQRVLIVDDNQDAARILSISVKMLGDEVKVAHDGQEALDVASQFHPDVVLLDLGMPRMDGFECARKMRSAPWGREILLVAVTGWGQDEDKRRTQEAGFDHHLVKPADPQVLKALLAERRAAPRQR